MAEAKQDTATGITPNLPPPVGITDKQTYGQDGGKKIINPKTGHDYAFDPFYQDIRRANGGQPIDFNNQVASLSRAQHLLHESELYAVSWTPKGSYITRVAPRAAFKIDWKFLKDREHKIRLDTKLEAKLKRIHKKYKVKKAVISAVQTAETFGRSLLYRRKTGSSKRVKKWKLFVCRLPDEWISWDTGTNEIDSFNPVVGWELGTKQLNLDPKDCVLFIGEIDPIGNGHEGIPGTLTSYNTIVRSENVAQAWAAIVVKRGLGLVDITVEGAETDEDLKPWAEKYGNPSSYTVMVHNERLQVKVEEGMKASFNLDETMGRYTKDVSSATGYPSMRMEGVQTGTVTGSETDQDNQAEMYATLHERYEDSIVETYYMLDQDDEDAIDPETDIFELFFPMDIKLDRGKQTNIFATEAGAVMTVQDIISVNEARERMGLPLWPDDIGNMTIAEYMDSQTFDLEDEEIPGDNPKKDGESNIDNIDLSMLNIDNFDSKTVDEWIAHCITKHVKGDVPPNMSRVQCIAAGLKKFGLSRDDKDRIGTILAMDRGFDETLSYSEVNMILKDTFGSGKSPNWIKLMRHG